MRSHTGRGPACLAASVIFAIQFLWGSALVASDGGTRAAPNASERPASASAAQASEPKSKTREAKSARESQTGEGEPVPAKLYRYAERLMQKYDRNGDGQLQADEWQAKPGNSRPIDANKDQKITIDELVQSMVAYGQRRKIRLAHPAIGLTEQAKPPAAPTTHAAAAGKPKDATPAETEPTPDENQPADVAELESARRSGRFYVSPKRLPAGLPAWFITRDEDGDGQLTLREFAPKPTAADLEKFSQYDLNGDGVITAQECLRAMKQAKPGAKKSSRP